VPPGTAGAASSTPDRAALRSWRLPSRREACRPSELDRLPP
jgi:hypothetical protein